MAAPKAERQPGKGIDPQRERLASPPLLASAPFPCDRPLEDVADAERRDPVTALGTPRRPLRTALAAAPACGVRCPRKYAEVEKC